MMFVEHACRWFPSALLGQGYCVCELDQGNRNIPSNESFPVSLTIIGAIFKQGGETSQEKQIVIRRISPNSRLNVLKTYPSLFFGEEVERFFPIVKLVLGIREVGQK